jgi:hypothetical protein
MSRTAMRFSRQHSTLCECAGGCNCFLRNRLRFREIHPTWGRQRAMLASRAHQLHLTIITARRASEENNRRKKMSGKEKCTPAATWLLRGLAGRPACSQDRRRSERLWRFFDGDWTNPTTLSATGLVYSVRQDIESTIRPRRGAKVQSLARSRRSLPF